MQTPYLNVKDVGEALGVTDKRVYQLIDQKQLPHVRRGKKRILIPREAFQRYLDGQVTEALAVVGSR